MKIKLSKKEYDYLLKFKKVNNDMVSEESKVIIDFDEDYLLDLHDWVNDQLLTTGFDENYELNDDGKILDNLVDILNV
ncbi:hypothetical protein [uncultured Psychroserpens sp.]|uniref:hypothetical protein n=1 Tax=uncultured Psychroserpens sp. TaxID=255436 RepID=UPI002629E222|nr:hypothetical protein [uncultured Psychroserpens sp.]